MIPNDLSKSERYSAFLLHNLPRLRDVSIQPDDGGTVVRTEVLAHTIPLIETRPGLSLEFGVWRGKSINACAAAYPDRHWVGFDSFEGFPDDGRIDWQKPFKVTDLPDVPDNVSLVKGYFSDTLDAFLQEAGEEVAFVNIDCDIYTSTVDVFSALERHGHIRAGLPIFFDELVNYADAPWNEMLAFFEMLERTGLGFRWHGLDRNLHLFGETLEMLESDTYPRWREQLSGGYWQQASVVLTEGVIDYGPLEDPAFLAQVRRTAALYDRVTEIRVERAQARAAQKEAERAERQARRAELQEERKRERLALQKERQEENRQRQEAKRRQRMAERKGMPESEEADPGLATAGIEVGRAPAEDIETAIKLVIWDLDETFWSGTLSEGGVIPVPEHVEMVRTLADRGIMSAICSKNTFDAAKAELEKLGIWDMFVFPHIDWTPKGQAIQNMLERAQLRAPNVLFLDDNHMNLEEAAFFNKGLITFDARQDLSPLLDMPGLRGKDDRSHSRLNQYRMLEAKQADQSAGAVDNLDFLRQSEIKVEIINDLEPHMDRVLELINRTNQLNFTKKRVESDQDREELEELLSTSGVHAGLVRATDRYGDYGLVGFFAARVKYNGTKVHHFCFSCRTLNMGVEQFVWERIGSPDIEVKGAVANPIRSFDAVDWISETSSSNHVFSETDSRSLCLVGGCDLLQVSFYCGSQRHEFVNKEQDGFLVRYDDPGFMLNQRDPLRHNPVLKHFPTWSWRDMVDFDKAVAESDVILLSLYFAVTGDNFFTFGGEKWGGEYLLKVPPRTLKKFMKTERALWFAKNFYYRPYSVEQAAMLTRKSLNRIARIARPDAQIFVMTAATKTGQQAERTQDIRNVYNSMCAEFCAGESNANLVDLDRILEVEEFQDSDHYTRAGYYKIAKFVNDFMDDKQQDEPSPMVGSG